MKNIGILTYHYSTNYGGVLQAYALQKVIEEKGFNVEIINYIPDDYNHFVIKNFSEFKIEIKRIINSKLSPIDFFKKLIIKFRNNKKAKDNFEKFRDKYMNIGKYTNDLSSHLNKFDYVIVGSDQVWNLGEQKKLTYFLNFKTTAKKISYAADSISEIPYTENFDILRECLNDFDGIMVRNTHTKTFVKNVINTEAKIVVDPSLLYNYDNLILNRSNEKYIFSYILGEEINGGHKKVISKIKKRYGNLPVYLFQISNMDFRLTKFADKVFYSVDPSRWVTLIANASFVYTDSFHGCLFALKYKRPIIAYYKNKFRASRFLALQQRYALNGVIYKNANDINLNLDVDFEMIHLKLSKDINFSRNLLFEYLNCNDI